jgi:hypothetical protein
MPKARLNQIVGTHAARPSPECIAPSRLHTLKLEFGLGEPATSRPTWCRELRINAAISVHETHTRRPDAELAQSIQPPRDLLV